MVFWFVICQDDGTDRVHVVGARGASGFVLTVGSEVFEESGRSLVRGTLDYLQGLKVFLAVCFSIYSISLTLLGQACLMVMIISDAWSQAN